MAKKSTGIRYDEVKFELARKETGKDTAQQMFDLFLDSIWFKHNPPLTFGVTSAKVIEDRGKHIGQFDIQYAETTPESYDASKVEINNDDEPKQVDEDAYSSEWFKNAFKSATDKEGLDKLVKLMYQKIQGKWSQGNLKEYAQEIFNDKFNF